MDLLTLGKVLFVLHEIQIGSGFRALGVIREFQIFGAQIGSEMHGHAATLGDWIFVTSDKSRYSVAYGAL